MVEKPNFEYIKKLSNGDREFEITLFEVLKKEFPEEVLAYKLNLKKANFKRAAENVHKLKNKISILGMEQAYLMSLDYENEIREGRISKKNKFHATLNEVADFIEKTTI
tara:strand:- start:247 stop:573 length:327 start_codon:yes stop_codon:yes gene_type:complete